MMISTGTKTFTKFLGYYGIGQQCTYCQKVYSPSLVRYRTWFHISEIPVVPYKTTYIQQCPICGNSIELEKQNAKAILNAGLKNDKQKIKLYGKHIIFNKPNGIMAVDSSFALWARDENTKEEFCLQSNVIKDIIKDEKKQRGIKGKIEIFDVE